jgi:integrase
MQKGLLIDTIGKYIECFKTFLTWAEDRKYNKFTVYKSFHNINKADRKRKKGDKDIVTLTLSELKTFYEYNFSDNPSYDRVRDLFCFEAFSGQRWSDMQQFDRSQLHGDIWRFTADKTKKEIEIDMTGFAAPALDILKKYDYKLPQISNQKFNEYLKDAAEKAGIDAQTTLRRFVGSEEIKMTKPKHRFLSSHSARRSAVSILLNDYNMNPVHVMEITGHSDLKTLQKYIKPDRQARRQAMSKTTPINEIMKVAHKAI